MITLLGGIALLIIGYFTYGKFIEKNFSIDPSRKTPAEVLKDGYDFVPMSKGKNAIIELLNIAGTGPIFGPIMGALYGLRLISGSLSDVFLQELFTIIC